MSDLAVLTSHHRDCAALWPEKACDCGYAEQHPTTDTGPIRRRCAKCRDDFDQPRRRGRPFIRCLRCR